MNDQEYKYLTDKIFQFTRLDLNGYKPQQIRRRLEGLIGKTTGENVIGYCRLLEKEPEKRRELVDFLAINVSEFFRDTNLFQYLKTDILPEMLKKSSRLNIWSAACSCGQEAYSIAILLEELGRADSRHRILATDIDETALATAKAGGPYPANEVRNVEKRFLQKYFSQVGEGYYVAESIRSKVDFRRHNLLLDRHEKGFDLIVCRNAIIYFSDQVREGLYEKFSQSIKTGGVLFIGGSEVILRPGDLGFGVLRPSFYRKLPVRAEAALPV
jgi:chemotaxis protein methyltransferase CheR